jgi:hypothetical protein
MLEDILNFKKPGKLASLALAGASLLGSLTNASAQNRVIEDYTGRSVSAVDGSFTKKGKVLNEGRSRRMDVNGYFNNLTVNTDMPILFKNTRGTNGMKYWNMKTWYDSRVNIDGVIIDDEVVAQGDVFYRIPRYLYGDDGRVLRDENNKKVEFDIDRFDDAHRKWLDGHTEGIARFVSPYVEGVDFKQKYGIPLEAYFVRSPEMAGKNLGEIPEALLIQEALEVVPLITDGIYDFANINKKGIRTKPKLKIVDEIEDGVGRVVFREGEGIGALPFFANEYFENGNTFEVVGGKILYSGSLNIYEHELGHLYFALGHSKPLDPDLCAIDVDACGGLMGNNRLNDIDVLNGKIVYRKRLGNRREGNFRDYDINLNQ